MGRTTITSRSVLVLAALVIYLFIVVNANAADLDETYVRQDQSWSTNIFERLFHVSVINKCYTSAPWLVAIFGFNVRIAAFAMPLLGIGAVLWVVGKGKTRSSGAILAEFGLLLMGFSSSARRK